MDQGLSHHASPQLRLADHTLHGAEPGIVLACTPIGCAKLRTGRSSYALSLTYQWVIVEYRGPSPHPEPRKMGVKMLWNWETETVGGSPMLCYLESGVVEGVACCRPCPPDTRWTTVLEGRAPCGDKVSGALEAYSAALGLPPNVVAGYYSTDPDFSFEVPRKTVRICGVGSYTLYGFAQRGTSFAPTAWLDYPHRGYMRRVVTI